jgi:hypothetical protein
MESIFDQQQLTGFVGMYNLIKSSIKNKWLLKDKLHFIYYWCVTRVLYALLQYEKYSFGNTSIPQHTKNPYTKTIVFNVFIDLFSFL